MKVNSTGHRQTVLGKTAPFMVIAMTVASLSDCSFAQEPDHPYAIFVVKGLGSFSDRAWTVSNHGHVGGHSFPPSLSGYLPFIEYGSSRMNLKTFGGADGEVQAIHDNGTAVGWAEDVTQDGRPFRWDEVNGLQDLGSLGEGGGRAYDINASGQIVGVTDMPGENHFEAFIWDDGVMINLGYLGDSMKSRAYAINDSGIVVGESFTNGVRSRPVMWRDNEIIDLGSLGGGNNRGEALDINNLDQVVGFSYDDDEVYHPFIWQDGTMYQLTPKTGYAEAINDRSQIVGSVFDNGFLWDPGKGLMLLNNLKPPRNPWRIEIGSDISDTGYITAVGTSSENERASAFLLVPVDPELKLSDPVPGVAGEANTWTITGAQPGSKIVFTYSLKGGGTVVPGCDKLDAVLQINNPKIMKSAIADANGDATIQMYVPPAARNAGNILFQAVSVKDCEESQLVVFKFE